MGVQSRAQQFYGVVSAFRRPRILGIDRWPPVVGTWQKRVNLQNFDVPNPFSWAPEGRRSADLLLCPSLARPSSGCVQPHRTALTLFGAPQELIPSLAGQK